MMTGLTFATSNTDACPNHLLPRHPEAPADGEEVMYVDLSSRVQNSCKDWIHG